MSENLLPCPFCGATDSEDNATQQAGVVLTVFKSPVGRPAHRVECQCGASGAAHLSALSAIDLWNTRAQTITCEWQDTKTAPKDGTTILMCGGVYHGVPFPAYWDASPYDTERPWVSVIGQSRLYGHIPFHWMPLPTPPLIPSEQGE